MEVIAVQRFSEWFKFYTSGADWILIRILLNALLYTEANFKVSSFPVLFAYLSICTQCP